MIRNKVKDHPEDGGALSPPLLVRSSPANLKDMDNRIGQ